MNKKNTVDVALRLTVYQLTKTSELFCFSDALLWKYFWFLHAEILFLFLFKAYYGMIFTFKIKLNNSFTSCIFSLVNFYLPFIANLRVASCCTLFCGCSCISNCVIIPTLWCCSLIGPHCNCQAVALFSVGCTLLRRKALADYQRNANRKWTEQGWALVGLPCESH